MEVTEPDQNNSEIGSDELRDCLEGANDECEDLDGIEGLLQDLSMEEEIENW